jgi:cell division transport system permease protein
MMKVTLKRIVRAGVINFWRNSVVTLASVLALSVTLVVIGGLILSAAFLSATLTGIQNKVDISVSFKLDASESEVLAMKDSLELLPEVKSVQYISREQELSDFRERHKDNALLIQSLDEVGNPFGARLNIGAVDPAQYETVAKFLEGKDSTNQTVIDQISFKKDVVEKLIAISRSARSVGVTISLILIFMSVLVTVNTISLAIYISRDEISVMRLVGAGNSYVRGPFLVEGILAGLIAAVVSLILLYPVSIWVKNITSGVYGGVDLVTYYFSNFFQLLIVLVLAGVVLGAVSSYLAIRKYATV